MNENKSTIDKLIQLSKIFKKGFTIAVKRSKASNKKKSIPNIIEIWSVNDLT